MKDDQLTTTSVTAAAVARKDKTRSDAAPRDARQLFNSSFDALAGHIAVLDESGTILEVNESWRRFARENQFTGTVSGEGTNYFEPCERESARTGCDPPIDGQTIARGIRQVIARERDSFEAEYPCHSPTQERWFLMRVTRFQGSGPVRVVIVHDEITERKRAQATSERLTLHFADHARMFDRLLSSLEDFAYAFDLDARFTFANRPLLDLWSLTLDQAIHKRFSQLPYPPALAAALDEQVRHVIQTRQSFRGETPYVGASGTTRHYQYIFSPVLDSAGAVVAVAGSTRDVTEQKQTEEELRCLVAERDGLLAKERSARVDAEAANRAKDRFLACLSHELRTPLTPVVMTVAAMELDAALPAAVREDAKMIRRNVELEVKLIDDLLDLSRITSGKLSMETRPLNLNDLLRHVCDMCQSKVREKGILLSCDLDDGIGGVLGDSARLHQVFWNLLNNAAKFTPERGAIRMTTQSLAGGGRVRVTVADTGIGIPADVLPRIFDAFEQGDIGVTRQFGGMGLGLAISKFLVEEHGGSIRAQTNGTDPGASFIVELPAIAEADGAAPPTIGPGPQARRAALRLLVVEDHADTAKVLGMMLSLAGHSVRTAMTGAAALALLDEHTFDVVVSDLGLPDMTGYDLMKRIKAKGDVTGICMSGYGMENDRRRSAEAGFAAHLVKPVDFAKLEATLRMLAPIPFPHAGPDPVVPDPVVPHPVVP